jgi:hypothetical protein
MFYQILPFLYKDPGHGFTNVFLSGNEWSLVINEICIFNIWFYLLNNTYIAIFLTWIISNLFIRIYQ